MPGVKVIARLDARRLEDTADPKAIPLSPRKRRRVNALFLEGTIGAVQASRMVDEVHAACHGRSLLGVARKHGAVATQADDQAAASGPPSSGDPSMTLRMAGLLPLLEAQDVAFLVGRALDGPRDVAVTPPHRREATLLLAANGEAIAETLRSPVERTSGRDWEVHRLEAALEVWEPDDLDRILRSPRGSRGKGFLRSALRGRRTREGGER